MAVADVQFVVTDFLETAGGGQLNVVGLVVIGFDYARVGIVPALVVVAIERARRQVAPARRVRDVELPDRAASTRDQYPSPAKQRSDALEVDVGLASAEKVVDREVASLLDRDPVVNHVGHVRQHLDRPIPFQFLGGDRRRDPAARHLGEVLVHQQRRVGASLADETGVEPLLRNAFELSE